MLQPERANGLTLNSKAPMPQLPLVSVIIINYNYGRFLGDAVRSVYAQTYANIECIAVDNASTDESPAILNALENEYHELRVIRRQSNDGQTPASLDGLAVSKGQYIIFLDADDLLLPACIETHIFAHLSSRIPIGLTSGDMLQIVNDDEIVLSTGEELSRYVRRRFRLFQPNFIRPYQHQFEPAWPSPEWAKTIASKMHYVRPLQTKWVWSPTSGNCFRRDALLLFADCPALAHLRTGTDLYFALGISGLTGSILIDDPVFAYRIHGGNIFSRRPQLNHTLNYSPRGHGDNNERAQLVLIDHLIANPKRFTPNGILTLNFIALVLSLDRVNPDAAHPRWRRRSRAAEASVDRIDALKRDLGSGATALLLLLLRVPLPTIWTAIRRPAKIDDLPT
jgi:glycosyltransferase involved in cell wall biosynthesis